MESNDTQYSEKFGLYAYRKYRNKPEPLNIIMFPLEVGGLSIDTDAIYARCLKENKPWQEIPELVNEIMIWYADFQRGIKDGEIS